MSILSSLLSSHLVLVLIAVFTFVSVVLTALSAALVSIGDKVPAPITSVLGVVAKVIQVLNGNFSSL